MEQQAAPPSYDRTFENFNSPLMQKFRELAYGKDVGQHSWTTTDELEELCESIKKDSNIIDVGCGAGGPLTYIADRTECSGTGLDLSEAAIRIAQGRARELGVSSRVSFLRADCEMPLPLPRNSFDVALSIDVILHLRNRALLLSRVHQVLRPGGTLIFTDAGVMTGIMTESERERRTFFGYTQFAPEGANEEFIARAGLSLRSTIDSTDRLIATASNRLRARQTLSNEFVSFEGQEAFLKQNTYLETIIDLAERRILSRFTYTASA